MGEEAKTREFNGGDVAASGNDDRVSEWEEGLPSADDLTPLSQSLIPPELASAFSISPEPRRTMMDVNRASQETLSSIRGQSMASNKLNFKSLTEGGAKDAIIVEEEVVDLTKDGSESRKMRRTDGGGIVEEADSAMRSESCNDDSSAAKTLKRPRLVWTPQLHKRFVDVVAHLGIKNAVPKTIMQLMNVEGLTRENVASHLQKYRLYLKRMQGLSDEGPSASDQLFASTPVPQSLRETTGGHGHGHGNEHGHAQVTIPYPMPYSQHMMQHMPMIGMSHGNGGTALGSYHGFESHPYGMVQHRDWSGNK